MVVGKLEGCFILTLEKLSKVSQAHDGEHASPISEQCCLYTPTHKRSFGTISLILFDCLLCRLLEALSF